MSLTRYENEDIIVQLTQPQYGQIFSQQDLDILPHAYLIPDDPNFVKSNISQVHIYSFYGNYIAGDHDASYLIHDPHTNSLLMDLGETFREANILRGSYIVAMNLFKQVWGHPDSHTVYIREISPDRTEVKLSVPSKFMGELDQFKMMVEDLKSQDIFNNLVIDFGFNRVSKITLIKFDKDDPSVIYLKLYNPLNDELEEKVTGWFGFETMNPYVDTVILSSPIESAATNTLRGANYDIDTTEWSSNSTVFKSWNDLLDTDATTSQRVIDMTLSGSASARLNIDYTDFNNYIFYSSAEERVKNFRYKVGLTETYQSSIDTLQNSTASNSQFVSSSVSTFQKRINTITSAFDSFERWMYYSDTASIFTHDISGSITPYPKYLSGGKYVLHPTTSSISTNWYNGLVASASSYDSQNHNRLWWSIPEHVLMDEGNSDYVLFVEMVGQHFDNLYSYTRALTQIHERDEHPERGVSNDLLYHVAKSFGWKLQNTKQLSDLWFYKAGTNSQGEYESTGSLFSTSHENQTQQIWRRIVNNLPYLLKTKGTTRSVKALMSIYGIPQTLISVKEYGGPAQSGNKPQSIEDRFAYALNFDGNQYVSMDRNPYELFDTVAGDLPQTQVFRFNTMYSGSAMTLHSIGSSGTGHFDLTLRHALELTGTSSFSGSEAYGRLEWNLNGDGTVVTEMLPLYDGDMWTVRMWTNNPVTSSTSQETFNLEVARADDCTGGTYILSGSGELLVTASGAFSQFRASNRVYLGTDGTSGGDAVNGFSGSIQGFKEYYTDIGKTVFDEHVLNPAAYHVYNPTSSYDYLYRYFPLGGDVIRYDHTTTTQVSSSHPNRTKNFETVATFNNFAGDQDDQYRSFRETYYAYTPSIGATNVRNNKIRMESSVLTRDLSPTARAEKSDYDLASNDTNRLAVVFSMADQVNRDVYNHMGFDELDQWIADPDLECANEYSELKRFSDAYFKKYTQKNDINAFIRILSVYDYSFFEQIKQLVPGRADLISGILIEPNILERSKVCISKPPRVTNPQWDKTIKIYEKDPVGEYPTYETSTSITPDFDIDPQTYVTASILPVDEFTIDYSYHTSSIDDPVEFIATSVHHQEPIHQKTGLCGVVDVYPNRYSGSGAPTQSIVDSPRLDCRYKKKVCYYSEWTGFTDVVVGSQFIETGSVWSIGDDGVYTLLNTKTVFSGSQTYMHLDTQPYGNFISIEGLTSVTQSLSTVSGNEYSMIIKAATRYDETVSVPMSVSMSNRVFDVGIRSLSTYNSDGADYIFGADLVTGLGNAYYVRDVEIHFTGSGQDVLRIYSNNTDFPVHIYSVQIFPKYSKWERKWLRLQNECINRAAYCVLEDSGYQIDECGTRNNSRFIGSKMSAADFNVDSPDTVDGGPVVTIIESNPNNLFIKDDGDDGNLLVE
jgi:hypothetical protein